MCLNFWCLHSASNFLRSVTVKWISYDFIQCGGELQLCIDADVGVYHGCDKELLAWWCSFASEMPLTEKLSAFIITTVTTTFHFCTTYLELFLFSRSCHGRMSTLWVVQWSHDQAVADLTTTQSTSVQWLGKLFTHSLIVAKGMCLSRPGRKWL